MSTAELPQDLEKWFGSAVAYSVHEVGPRDDNRAPYSFDPTTIARAYRRIWWTAARGSRRFETLPPAPAGSRRVLVVDDDTVLSAKILRELRGGGLDASCSAPNEDLIAAT